MLAYVYVRICVCEHGYVWMCVCSCACVCEHRFKCRGQKSTSGIFFSSLDFETESLIECEAHWFHDTGLPGRPKEPLLSVSPSRGS